jgi:uncharacterized membrane protein
MATKKAKVEVIKQTKLERYLPWMLTVGGIIGLICSLVLTYDQVKVWENPAFQPACNLNPILSCGNVMNSGEGHILGIPGPFFGLITFAILTTIGMALLAGAKLKRWFWQGLQLGALAGVGYALWLFWLSLFKIHALCPFCLAVDTVVYILAWYITLYNIEKGHIAVPSFLQGVARFARRHHLDLLVLWFLIVAGYILYHFWYYFGKHLPF